MAAPQSGLPLWDLYDLEERVKKKTGGKKPTLSAAKRDDGKWVIEVHSNSDRPSLIGYLVQMTGDTEWAFDTRDDLTGAVAVVLMDGHANFNLYD